MSNVHSSRSEVHQCLNEITRGTVSMTYGLLSNRLHMYFSVFKRGVVSVFLFGWVSSLVGRV